MDPVWTASRLLNPAPTNRVAQAIDRRRQALAAEWDLRDQIVVIGAGWPGPITGRGDLTYPFRSHPEFFYLTDSERPGGVLAFDPTEGWLEFVVPISRDEHLWGGGPTVAADDPLPELAAWLEQRRARPVVWLGVPPPDVDYDHGLEMKLRTTLNALRRQKDDVELARMRHAARATQVAFAEVVLLIQPGAAERELQIELEASLFRSGADGLAFHTVVGSGPNAAILHASPTKRRLAHGDLVLIDAGAEYRGYASDVTRTYPASGSFTSEQAELYDVVRSAAATATERCMAGTEFAEVHRTAALVIASGLVDFGLLRGDPQSLVDQGAHAVFFPHGVGHLVGLGVGDASEVLPGRVRPAHEFPRLRVDLPLLIDYVLTIEPGVYFVPALINDQGLRERYRGVIDWERAENMVGFGGIRIENDVLVTKHEPEVLTDFIPMAP